MCFFMWIGPAREVFKTEFPHLIERGVPFSADGLFVDLFVRDPLYVMVDPDKAKAMLDKLKAAEGNLGQVHGLQEANVGALQDAAKLKLKDWYAERDANRALLARPAPVFGAPGPEPAPPVKPQRKGGGV